MAPFTAIETIAQPLTLPCGLTLPNRLVKCPMQETLAQPPNFDPPIDTFRNLYTKWAGAKYGLIITGQVQVDPRFLSVAGDVVAHPQSLQSPHFEKWEQWARIAKLNGTPCIVQLAHPGRMSPIGAGDRPKGMRPWCPSAVPVKLADDWLNEKVQKFILPEPKAMTVDEIDEFVEQMLNGARVAKKAGFDGVQIHAAHGFLVSQFLSSHTNRRNDAYGGNASKRLKLLQRLVQEIRTEHPRPFCLSVKLNSADYMHGTGLEQDEGLEQVRWLIESEKVDFVEISGGNAEQKNSGLHNSFASKNRDKAPQKQESTRIREGFFTEFAEKVQKLQTQRKQEGKQVVPIQLSGGFRSRVGMADAIDSGVTDMIGLGRTAVLEPDIPTRTILNPSIADDAALGSPGFQLQGLWLVKWFPIKIVGRGFGLQFFYHNMRRMGKGLTPTSEITLPQMVLADVWETIRSGLLTTLERLMQPWQGLSIFADAKKID